MSIIVENILLQRWENCWVERIDNRNSWIAYTIRRYLVFYNPSPPRMFFSLDLLSEYRIQHGAIGPLYVTSSYSTWIFCKGVSDFTTDCPCDVWCRGLTTCLLHVGPPFWKSIWSNSWAVGLTKWIVYLHFFLYFDICNYICLDTSYNFFALSLLLNLFSSTHVLTSSIDIVLVLSTINKELII